MLKDGGMEGAGAQGKFGNKDLPDMQEGGRNVEHVGMRENEGMEKNDIGKENMNLDPAVGI